MTQFPTIFKQKCSYLRPLLSFTFPQGFRISENIGHPTSGIGCKTTFKRYLKSEQTHRHTDRRTDGRTNRLIKSFSVLNRALSNTHKKNWQNSSLSFFNVHEKCVLCQFKIFILKMRSCCQKNII